MSKKLVIKFWKAKCALAMQILEQEGLPKVKSDGFVNIETIPAMYKDTIYLRGDCRKGDFGISGFSFKNNSDRDEHLDNIIKAIRDELFTGTGELKIGEMCEVRHDERCTWGKHKLLAILPEEYDKRYIVATYKDQWMASREARPLRKRTEPKVEENGEIITYTWEEE